MNTKSRVNVGLVKKPNAHNRHRKVLMVLLEANCQRYSWFQEVLNLVQHNHWDKLYRWSESVTTDVYDTAEEYFSANQIAALVKKYPRTPEEFGFTESPESVAIRKFFAAEKQCELTNKRFRTLRGRTSSYRRAIEYMKTWIHRTLGELDIQEVYDQCSFSSGAAIGVHGNATNLFRKIYAKDWTVSRMARDHALRALRNNPQIFDSFSESKGSIMCYDRKRTEQLLLDKCKITRFNKVSFVPKTAKTHRSIAVEPLLNSYLQKGIDTVMRRKLLEQGYDLSDQGRNSHLAKIGSIHGKLATVDLSSASDTVASDMVRFLLPSDWIDLLDRARSCSYELKGKIYPYHKYASMGNGFCFPLETLIFAAAVRASIWTSKSAITTNSVYGDDIIVPVDAFKDLSKLLKYLGFTLNREKTFNTGPFRESCGADWYEGQDVRPVYLDYLLSDDVRLMIFHNATLRSEITKRFFEPVRTLLREWVPFRRRMLRLETRLPKKDYTDFSEVMFSNGAFSVDMDTFMGGRWTYYDRATQIWRWREVHSTPQIDEIYRCFERDRAQYLSFLRGSPSGNLSLRRKVKLTYIVK